MAQLNDMLTGQGAGEPVHIMQVVPSRRHEALALLLTGGLRGARPAVSHFLGFARQQALSLEGLWAAYPGPPRGKSRPVGRPLAAALVVPAPGRTAMVFTCPVSRSAPAPLTAQVVRTAVGALDPGQVRLAQCLLEPGQRDEATAMTLAGFHRLAHLLYMQRPAGGQRPLALDPAIEPVIWSPAQRALFADAVLTSYQGTQDCPGLLGLREIDDIIDGHMATGDFNPSLWLALRCGDEPVAVLLLNPVLQRQALEVVYIGISPPWRGRGLGRTLLSHALGLAQRHRLRQVILAVDELNAPALKLYRSMQFVTSVRKLAMICALP